MLILFEMLIFMFVYILNKSWTPPNWINHDEKLHQVLA